MESTGGSLELYQNQNREIILHFKGEKTIQTVKLYDLKGSLIYSTAGTRPLIPAMYIPAGIYIIRAVTGDRVYASKILLK